MSRTSDDRHGRSRAGRRAAGAGVERAADDPAGGLRGYALDLLVVFAVLLRGRNVTRAAEQHMSRAAVSAALGRLRKLFGDPLPVRAPGGAAPPRAPGLAAPAREGLAREGLASQKAAVAGEPAFDPARDVAVFRLGVSDGLEALLPPGLIATVRAASPASSAFCLPAGRTTVAALLTAGEVQIGVAACAARGPDIRGRTLVASGHACLWDPVAAGGADPLTRAEHLAPPHVTISADGTRGIVGDVLDAENLTRRRVVSTAHFATAPLLPAGTASVATLPRHAAEVLAGRFGLQVCARPVPLPRFTVSALWHQGSAADPRVRWLVETRCGPARTLMPPPGGISSPAPRDGAPDRNGDPS
ncbi:LysR substrate-binding domain-containing protein [Streptomyces sp. BRB081]|uniref:LysR substrate-binding domain-containing protein n=1 Tax=Streptomyces sp. BRB081 TaxID=2769544 RepID=UPI0018ACBB5B|nr:LysR substrate-binding domain-containing protein [Streptomyces sp. BRB081]MBL3804285.1 LysR family transcriptional regulator [Streptomyces sp. BRB081]